jgi:hypothetical protein
MTTRITVRVQPRSGRTVVQAGPGDEVLVRVKAAPEGGKATEEARRAIARALRVPASAVTLQTGARSRTKVFAVEGVAPAEVHARLHPV